MLLTQVGELSDEPPRLEEILEWLLAGGLVNKTGPQNKPGFFDSLRARWETLQLGRVVVVASVEPPPPPHVLQVHTQQHAMGNVADSPALALAIKSLAEHENRGPSSGEGQ